jgi:hypothetical protein
VSDRLPRPPVRLLSAQPDGTANGLSRAAAHFLGPEHDDTRYIVLEVERDELRHKDPTDTDVAVLRAVRAAMPADQEALAAMVREALDAEFETSTPLFSLTERGRYEQALHEWRDGKGLTDADVQREWVALFGEQIPGPAGAETAQLVEFVLEMRGALDDDEPAQ